MEARNLRAICAISANTQLCAVVVLAAFFSLGASYGTKNFVVTAPTQTLAKDIGDAAERYREELAQEWLGRPLPRWTQRCPIIALLRPGAGGKTQFTFVQGQPRDWSMEIQGSPERILDSVLPHEITHTIFATHFGRPLPRWADEGACTAVEHSSERKRQEDLLVQFLRAKPPRSIPFNQMYRMREYPRDIFPLYAQGHSVARFLLHQGGKRKFVDYIGRGMQTEDWDGVTNEFYGYRDLSELQLTWIDWVAKGSPEFGGDTPALASRGAAVPSPSSLTITTPLPPLLRPTDNSPQGIGRATGNESEGQSWYAQQRHRTPPVNKVIRGQSEDAKSTVAPRRDNGLTPRSLLPPATYAGEPTPSAQLEWRSSPNGSTARDGEDIWRRKPVRFDPPIPGRYTR